MYIKNFCASLSAIALVFILSACSNDGKIIEEYENGNYTAAAALCQPRADKGDPKCLYLLGRIYVEGNGVASDSKKGIEMIRQAADAGHHYAQYYFGVAAGLNQEMQKADMADIDVMDYMYKAAKAGLPEAQCAYYSMKKLLAESNKDFVISEEEERELDLFISNAVEKGNEDAMITLASKYCVPISTSTACGEKGIPVLEKASGTTKTNFLRSLGMIRYSRNEFDKAVEPLKKAAYLGDAESAFYLGRIFIVGRGNEDGYKWMKIAAEGGVKAADSQLVLFKNPNMKSVLDEGERRYLKAKKQIQYNKMILEKKNSEIHIRNFFLDKF